VSNVRPHVAEKAASYEVLKDLERSAPWPRVPLTEAVDLNPKPKRGSLSDELEVSFVPMAAVEAGTGGIDTSTVRRYREVKKGYTYFRDGDVLFAKITPCMENGKIAVARKLRNGIGFGSTEFHVLRPREGVDALYIYHFVSSAQFRAEAAHHMTGAVGQKRVPTLFLEQSEIPLPPIDKQRRIVTEIEKQFSRLDEAVADLKHVKANLKRYWSAVLKAAVEGRLVPTEAELARREGRSYETGAQLLQRVLETRHSQWKGKGKYKEPAALETRDLPELPEGWAWITLDQLTSKITSGSRDWSPFYGRGKSIFVLAQNVRPLVPDFSVQQFVDPPGDDPSCERSRIQDGDLLTTIVGANTGQVCLVGHSPGDAYVCQSVALMRPALIDTGIYLNYWLNSDEHGQRYFDRCMYGQGRPHLSFEQLMATPIALPPVAEQRCIVAEVDRRLSLVREVDAEVDTNLKRGDRLRQSVLQHEFRTND